MMRLLYSEMFVQYYVIKAFLKLYDEIAHMIIVHGYSLHTVEHAGFRVFVKTSQPLFELVTFNRVEADCLEIYEKEKEKVSKMLDKLPGTISLTADVWTGSNDAECLCLTANYIDESWQLKRKLVLFVNVDPSQTQDMLSEVIMMLTESYTSAIYSIASICRSSLRTEFFIAMVSYLTYAVLRMLSRCTGSSK